jgi:uncharacterized membrane protein
MRAPLPAPGGGGSIGGMPHLLYVLAASYDDVEDALAEYGAIEAAYTHVSSSSGFDATVVAKDARGKVEIVRRHDEPVRHGTSEGLMWGLAVGAVAALFPAVGILGALAVGGGAGAALGAMAGHAGEALSRDDLKALGDVLDEGDAGLVVVYPEELSGHVTGAVKAAKSKVRASANVTLDELAADVRSAEAKG